MARLSLHVNQRRGIVIARSPLGDRGNLSTGMRLLRQSLRRLKPATTSSLAMTVWVNLLTLILCTPLFASFENLGAGARIMGLGGVSTIYSDDAFSVFANPSAIAILNTPSIVADYQRLYIGLSDESGIGEGMVGGSMPVSPDAGTFGFGWSNRSLTLEKEQLYYENQFRLAYGYNFWQLTKENLTAGLAFKIMSLGYDNCTYMDNAINEVGDAEIGTTDLTFENGKTGLDYSLDVGALWKRQSFKAGFVVGDILTPDTALNKNDSDKLPVFVRTACGITVFGTEAMAEFEWKNPDWKTRFGIEKTFLQDMFGVRAGGGIGSRSYANISAGLSYCWNHRIRIDYGFQWPLSGIVGTYGTHRASLVVMLPQFSMQSAEEIVLPKTEKIERVQEEKKVTVPAAEQKTPEETEKERLQRYYGQGLKHYKNGEYEQAVAWWEKLLELEPDHAESKWRIKKAKENIALPPEQRKQAYLNECLERGRWYLQQENIDEARIEFEKVIKMDPSNKEAREYLDKLK